MSYNFAKSLLASEVRSLLPSLVTDAKKSAPRAEHELIELAGQCAHVVMSDIADDSLVDLQAYGSDTPSQGTGTFYISISYKPTRSIAPVIPQWDHTQGPLAVRAPTESATNQKIDTSSA